MLQLLFLVGIIIFFGVIFLFFESRVNGDGVEKEEIPRSKYQYKRKMYFLSRAEHEFYDALMAAVGKDYYVFAQVHLPTLLENKVAGQNWRAAFKHISEKSVDYVLCDKNYISPKLAIELDDKTHARSDRQTRDIEVERILQGAGLPLLRIQNFGKFVQNELRQKIEDKLIIR